MLTFYLFFLLWGGFTLFIAALRPIPSIPYKFHIAVDSGSYFGYCSANKRTSAVFSYHDGYLLQHEYGRVTYIQPGGNVGLKNQATVRFNLHELSLDEYKQAKCKVQPRSTIEIYPGDKYVTITSADGQLILTSNWPNPFVLQNDNTLSAGMVPDLRASSILRLVRFDLTWNRFVDYDCKTHSDKFDVEAFKRKHKEELETQISNAKGKEDHDCVICQESIPPGNIFKIHHQVKNDHGRESENCGLKYCLNCLQMWYDAKRNCPLCHKAIFEDEIVVAK
jgi:hypothetical protein